MCFKKLKFIMLISLSILNVMLLSSSSFADNIVGSKKVSEIFPDESFAQKIKYYLKKTSINDYISQGELNSIEKFDYRMNFRGLAYNLDIEGMQYLNNLKYCAIVGGNVISVKQLSRLTKLCTLFLDHNCICDLTPLSNLHNLTHLNLSNNRISGLSQLSNLNSLCWLDVAQNQVSDLSPIKKLKKLKTLSIIGNPVNYTQFASLRGVRIFYLDSENVERTYLVPDLRPNFILKLFGLS